MAIILMLQIGITIIISIILVIVLWLVRKSNNIWVVYWDEIINEFKITQEKTKSRKDSLYRAFGIIKMEN